MTTKPGFPSPLDQAPVEPDWDALTGTLSEAAEYLTDADWNGAIESVILINMLLAALEEPSNHAQLMSRLLHGVREIIHYWGFIAEPNSLTRVIDGIWTAVANIDDLEARTLH